VKSTSKNRCTTTP